MKILINVECEDEKDLMIHLSVIRQQIRQSFKINPNALTHEIADDNCYGHHHVKITMNED